MKLVLSSNPIIYWKDKLCDNKRTDGRSHGNGKAQIISWVAGKAGCGDGEGLGVVSVGSGGDNP